MKNMFSKANAPFLIASALASFVLLTSGVFTVAPYVAFLASITALNVALPVTLTLFVLSAIVIAFSYKIICQNKKLDLKEIELNRLAKEQENTIKNLKTKIKDLDEKNDLAQNVKELESEKVKLASKSKELKVQIKRLNDEKQESEAKLSTKAQENDDGYNSGINTPITFSGNLSPTLTLNRSVEHLELYEKNQKATPKGQRKKILPPSSFSPTSSEDDSSFELDDHSPSQYEDSGIAVQMLLVVRK